MTSTSDDFIECGRVVRIAASRARQIIDEVLSAIRRWTTFAGVAGTPDDV
jgi:hypothetical protein